MKLKVGVNGNKYYLTFITIVSYLNRDSSLDSVFSSHEDNVLKVSFCVGPLSVVNFFSKSLKIFLLLTTRPIALIFSM